MSDENSELPTPQVLKTWPTVSQALSYFRARWHREEAIRTLKKALLEGFVTAVSERATSTNRDKVELKIHKIPPEAWEHENYVSGIWSDSYLEYRVQEGWTSNASYRTFVCFGVRLEPSGVAALLPPHGQPLEVSDLGSQRTARGSTSAARIGPPYRAKPLTATNALKKVTKDELRQWFPTYEGASQDFRYESVKAAADKHFAPRTVTRRPVSEIIGEFGRKLTRGKPSGI